MSVPSARLPPFQRFLDAHRDDVLRFLIASVGRDDADDAFQETFLSALRAYERLAPDSNLHAWVLTIAHRKALDVHRARERRPVPVPELDDRATPTDEHAPAAGDHWERVRTLPPRQRAVLTLRYAPPSGTSASMPVSARPMMSCWICDVPS